MEQELRRLPDGTYTGAMTDEHICGIFGCCGDWNRREVRIGALTVYVYAIDGITSVTINGQELGLGGYLDIGLYDTIGDLFVNFIGAVVFSTIGYFYIKQRGKGKLAKAFIPTITEEEGAAELPEGTEALPEGTEESE